MGLCVSSSGATAAASAPRKAPAAALVLLPTGELREYPLPATAARALADSDGWFLCDADRMELDGPAPAVRGDEELRAGQIYFALPAEARRRGMRREEVAALAVTAAAALAARETAGRRRRGAVVAPVVFSPPPEREEENCAVARETAAASVKMSGSQKTAGKGRTRRRFASGLTAIPECEISD